MNAGIQENLTEGENRVNLSCAPPHAGGEKLVLAASDQPANRLAAVPGSTAKLLEQLLG
jgi:hypothetical protein